MHQKDLRMTVEKAFGNLYRKQCTLVAVENEAGKILIGAKPYFYPPTIARMLGGGVDPSEEVETALIRELSEELGIILDKSFLTPLIELNTYATDADGKEFHNKTFIYHAKIGNQKYQAGDDVKSITELTVDELYQLGERYEELPDTLWYKGPEGEFCWADYAKMYGPIHKLTVERLRKL
jgi:8-oxo-dGTP pyrophosphatase MutT (NUDIX family)